MVEPIYINSNELAKLKVIGEGTDGKIYKLDNKTLLKIYHHSNEYFPQKNKQIYDNEGVNITPYKNNDFINTDSALRYYDTDGVKLSREMAIIRAIERQENVKKTKLPKNLIYVDGKLKGCVIDYHRFCTNIYKALNLPYAMRLKIARNILEKVKELLDANIYHIDLAQCPTVDCKNTNVLLTKSLKPEIIDIDGKSAIYTESFSKNYYRQSLYSLNVLIIELLSRLNLHENLEDLNVFDLSDINHNFPLYMLEDFKEDKLTLSKMTSYLK